MHSVPSAIPGIIGIAGSAPKGFPFNLYAASSCEQLTNGALTMAVLRTRAIAGQLAAASAGIAFVLVSTQVTRANTINPPLPVTANAPSSKGDREGNTPPASGTEALGKVMWSSSQGGTANRVNTSGQPLELDVALQDDDFLLGNVLIKISTEDEVSLRRESLRQILSPLLRENVIQSLSSVLPSQDYIPIADLAKAGFIFRLNTEQMVLHIDLTVEQRAKRVIDGGGRREMVKPAVLSAPAAVSGYMNIHAGVDYVNQSVASGTGVSSADISWNSAIRVSHFVVENEGRLLTDGHINREGTRVVMDSTEDAVRTTLGDISPMTKSFQGQAPLLGIQFEKNYEKLQPGTNVRPTSSHSFRLEEAATVEVIVNGNNVQRLHLRPGEYDIKDLPLASGANDITLVIIDAAGEKRTLKFSAFSGGEFLAPGVTEGGLSMGIISRQVQRSVVSGKGDKEYGSPTEMVYDPRQPVLTGYQRVGIMDNFTGGAHFQIDSNIVMGGVETLLGSGFGRWLLGAAVSSSATYSEGVAAQAGYEIDDLNFGDGVRRSLRFIAEHRSQNFMPINTLAPNNSTIADFSAAYSQELPWEISGTLSGSYSLSRNGLPDGYNSEISLGKNLGQYISAGFIAGYMKSAGSREGGASTQDGIHAALRISCRLDEKTAIEVSHDTQEGLTQIAAHQQAAGEAGSMTAEVELNRHEKAGVEGQNYHDFGTAISFAGNRTEVAASRYAATSQLNSKVTEQHTTASIGSSVAFADGQFAIGRPVTDGFAIISAHENLGDRAVTVGGGAEMKRAATDFFGPALVPDLGNYTPARMQIGVEDLPDGYDLGSGAFDLNAPYKAGYRLTVGSDYTVSAMGTLVDEHGECLSMLAGEAREEGQQDGRRVQFFTSSNGRFSVQGLRPGKWTLEIPTSPVSRYNIEVPKGTVGLLKLDTLKPAQG
jgi:outer membrane usher protein